MSVPPGFPGPSGPQGPPNSGQPNNPFGSPVSPPFGSAPVGPPSGFGPQGGFGPQTNLGGTPDWLPQETPPDGSGRKPALIIGAIVLLAGAGVVAFLVTRDDDKKSVQSATSQAQEQIDDVLSTAPTIPTDITIPPIPSFTIPDFSIPPIPSFTIPEFTIPDFTIPAISLPPGVTLPPGVSLPTIPGGEPSATTIVTTSPTSPQTTVPVAPTNLFAGTQAAEVITEIATARGAAPLRILQALFYPEYAFASVQDPTIPANVDEYQWRGTVGVPTPVRLTGDGDLEANLFSDTEVNWAVIPTLVETALAQIPIEGAEVTHISVERNLPFSDTIQIRVFVNGTRTSGYLDADAQGNVLAVNPG